MVFPERREDILRSPSSSPDDTLRMHPPTASLERTSSLRPGACPTRWTMSCISISFRFLVGPSERCARRRSAVWRNLGPEQAWGIGQREDSSLGLWSWVWALRDAVRDAAHHLSPL